MRIAAASRLLEINTATFDDVNIKMAPLICKSEKKPGLNINKNTATKSMAKCQDIVCRGVSFDDGNSVNSWRWEWCDKTVNGQRLREFIRKLDQKDLKIQRQAYLMMVFRGSAEILGFGSEEEFPRFPRFRWLPRLQLNKLTMIRGVLRNENSTTCGRDDNFIDLR
ncbi:hypothetical protein PoB_002803000 [Plakobranchus ocellatus]|uniref:Protein Wnt n=1 Tax=Plakobranchus ocellatus TaxID=259542 RepID=A0AAV4A079_9GAST|nr:hypothetical protein PoB_002803000 [Plakobranchus ocellatus]